MKKIWLFILSLFTIFLVWNYTQAKDYEYTNLDITANILEDWTINVKENFNANFFVSKHWIIRDIPLNYSVWWNDFHIEVSNINVQWKNFTTDKNNWNIEIKIWDADKTLIWKQNYPISYSVYGLIRNFSWMWYAELYWNLVGYDFDTNIDKVRTEIILPKAYTWFTKNDFLITTDWKSKTIDWFEWTVDWSKWDRIIITYNKWLPAKQGITLAIKFPNNYFVFNHKAQEKLIWHTKDIINIPDEYIPIACFVLILTISSIFLILKQIFMIIKQKIKLGINPIKHDIIVQYDPPKWLNSAEVWLLYNKKATTICIVSLIYSRAAEWLISISSNNRQKDIILQKLNDISSKKHPEYECNFFISLFDGDLWKKWRVHIHKNTELSNVINPEDLYNYWENSWRFKKNNNISDGGKLLLIWLISFISMFFIAFSFNWDEKTIIPYMAITCFILSIVDFLCGVFFSENLKQNERTEKWEILATHILWYKKFLKKCDENKIKLFLKEDPLYFDKILPYAIIFWLETKVIETIIPIMEEMNLNSSIYDWNVSNISNTISILSSSVSYHHLSCSSNPSYSSSSWHSSWSSFSSWWSSFSSWWGGGWWGWRSW